MLQFTVISLEGIVGRFLTIPDKRLTYPDPHETGFQQGLEQPGQLLFFDMIHI